MGSRRPYQDGVDKVCSNILDSLEEDGVSRVLLVGEAGIGKTWMARKICERATKRGSCYIALWLNLNKELDEMLLYEGIASQLSLFLQNEGSEEDDSDDDNSEDEEEQKSQDLMRLKAQIHKKIKRKKLKGIGKNYPLLVLDDEGSVTNEEKVMKDLCLGDFFAPYGPLKILLTRRKGEEDANAISSDGEIDTIGSYGEIDTIGSDGEIDTIGSDGEIEPHAMDESDALLDYDGKITSIATDKSDDIVCSRMEMGVPPTGEPHASMDDSHALLDSHTIDKSKTLHDTLTDDYMVDLLEFQIEYGLPESLEKAWGGDHGSLIRHIGERSMRLTAAVVVLAKSINCISQKLPFSLSPKQDEVLKKAILSSFSPDTTGVSRCNPILHLTYELLETDDTMKYNIVDCFWHSLSLFEHCGCIHYQELIAHWILEGYFDPVRSVSKAYKDGHAILMELINRGFLKVQEDNVVMPEVAMKNVIDIRRRGLSGTSRIGLAKICGSDTTKGLGNINQVDDFIKGVRATRKGEKITTILVSGDRLRRVTLTKFFEKLEDLEVLGLFKPTSDPFVPAFSKPLNLRVLIIRDCDLLEDIEQLTALHGLHALEVSGASSLKKISDKFFKELSKLQSLHLSGLQITSSPSSISQLKELHCLIIRDCPLLEDLPDIQELVKLEVVDISGARGLQTCFDNTKGDKKNKSKNKNFYHLTKLQLIDFSESQIERLPMFQDADVAAKFHSLTRLLLCNCRKLIKLPNLKPFSGLQILDLSGTTSLVKMVEVCFEDKKELRIVNLSGSNLRYLPSTIEELSSLNELLLRDCTNLEALPNIEKLTNLEVFDVSGCAKLHTIEGSFVDMSYLREIDLSGTKVKIPPELPKESKLYCPKRIILADKRLFEGEDWSEVSKSIQLELSENASSSDADFESQEIKEIQPNEPRASDCSGNEDVIKERLLQVPINEILYEKTLSFFDSASQQEVMEINETNELGEEALANAESVSFVDCSSSRITSIFNKINSVKSCWVRMSVDTKILFSGVDEERLGSLETLSITNLPLLETISCGGSLKELSIDCCPNIITLFPEASKLPSSLKDLHAKYCEKLENVVTGVELPTLTNLKERVDKKTCPKFNKNSDDWVVGV